MKTRQLIILAGIAIFLGGCFGMRYLSSLKEGSDRNPPIPSIRSVEFNVVENQLIEAQIPVTGKLVAKEKIELYAEVNGNLLGASNNFKEGNKYNSGQALVIIDNSELLLSIQSQKSTFLSLLTRVLPDLKLDYPAVFEAWKKYADDFSVKKTLAELPLIQGNEKYYLSTQGVFNQYYAIKSQEARLAKYVIYAPFSGTVSQALIKPGTLVRAGQKLGEFINTSVFEMEVSIDLTHLSYVKVGSKVPLSSSQIAGNFEGKVARISDALDAATQSAKIIIEIKDPNLKEGMYLSGAILTEPFENVYVLAKNQISANNEAYVIEDGKLKARKVTPLFIGENEVVSADFKTGEKILRSIYAGAFDGARVQFEGDGTSKKANEGPKSDED